MMMFNEAKLLEAYDNYSMMSMDELAEAFHDNLEVYDTFLDFMESVDFDLMALLFVMAVRVMEVRV